VPDAPPSETFRLDPHPISTAKSAWSDPWQWVESLHRRNDRRVSDGDLVEQ
jgi:hypothetical protein